MMGSRKVKIDCLESHLRLDKESDGGRWALIGYLPDGITMLRLLISVGGRWDWYSFRAEVQEAGGRTDLLAEFDIAPLELIPHQRIVELGIDDGTEPWDPEDEPKFKQLPLQFRASFARMVWTWGRLVEIVVPEPAWLSLH